MKELILASSSVDNGIGCWDLVSGAEQLRYLSCASPPHGLVSLYHDFLASSQLHKNPSSSSASILIWYRGKPQVQVRSFPAENIGPLVSDSDGSYIIGGGQSGDIYFWEIASGKLLTKWTAHCESVTCLTLSDDDSVLISGSNDGCIRVWPLLMIFDDVLKESGENIYTHSFSEHALRITSIISSLNNSIVISSSEDRTCKVWSLSHGKLIESITFPFIIDAIAMGPWEDVFYAGCRDGKIYVVGRNVHWSPARNKQLSIIDSLSYNSETITCLAFSTDGVTLVSGSEDGTIGVWNTKIRQMIRLFRYAEAPVSNVLIVRQPTKISQVSSPEKDQQLIMPRPLHKYFDPNVESIIIKRAYEGTDYFELENHRYPGTDALLSHIKELQGYSEQWKILCGERRTIEDNELLNDELQTTEDNELTTINDNELLNDNLRTTDDNELHTTDDNDSS